MAKVTGLILTPTNCREPRSVLAVPAQAFWNVREGPELATPAHLFLTTLLLLIFLTPLPIITEEFEAFPSLEGSPRQRGTLLCSGPGAPVPTLGVEGQGRSCVQQQWPLKRPLPLPRMEAHVSCMVPVPKEPRI